MTGVAMASAKRDTSTSTTAMASKVPAGVLSADGSPGHTTPARSAFSYLRVSSAKQATEDRSGLDRQGDAFLPFCDRHGLVPSLDPVIDAGISAFRGSNRRKGALASFLEAARNGTVPAGAVLVVEDLDRFSRESASYAEATLLELFELGLAIGIVRDDVVVDRATYDREIGVRLQFLVRRDAAHDYSRKLSERVAAAHERTRARSRQGEQVATHWRPQWLDFDEASGAYVLNDRWPTYRRALDLCLEGLGQSRVARQLNAEGHRNAHGNLWSGAAVARIWCDRRLLGERSLVIPGSDEREIQAGHFPAAITRAEFDQLREVVAKRCAHRGRAGRGDKRHNLFQGLLHCECGAGMRLEMMVRKNGDCYGYLVCRDRIIQGAAASECQARNVRYDEDWILRSFMAQRWARYFDRPADNRQKRLIEGEIRTAEGLLAQQRQHQQQAEANLAQLLTTGALDADTAALLGKVVKDARLQADATEADLSGLRDRLRQASARPDGAAMQKAIRARVEAFLAVDRSDPAERVRFNAWLNTLPVQVTISRSGTGATTLAIVEGKPVSDGAGGVMVPGAEWHADTRGLS